MRISNTLFAISPFVLMVGFLIPGTVTLAEESQSVNFGGPDAVENQILEDAQERAAFFEERLLQPWFDWKASLQEDHGIHATRNDQLRSIHGKDKIQDIGPQGIR